jgi:hypothetical protein
VQEPQALKSNPTAHGLFDSVMSEASGADGESADMTSTSARSQGAARMHALEVIVGLFAGVAALIYITGGVALGLRLLFAGLPSLPVGQLPREFLFSLGAAQVVVPAVALAVVAGIIELGQRHQGLVFGHLPWSEAKQRPALRGTYIAYYAAVPFLLIAPGLAVAVITDDAVEHPAGPVVVLAAAAVTVLAAWASFAWSSRVKEERGPPDERRGPPDERRGPSDERRGPPDDTPRPGWHLWAGVLGGAIMPVVFAVWLSFDVDDARYAGIIGAWLVSLLFALLAVWWRAQVGEWHRREAASAVGLPKPPKPGDRKRIADVPPSPWLVVLSWGATAVLLMPALVAITAAWPLSDAVVCAQPTDRTTYAASGRFVGETNDRVYIGDKTSHRIISVPSRNVSRVLVGRTAAHTRRCKDRAN